jgi:hypothetical protein
MEEHIHGKVVITGAIHVWNSKIRSAMTASMMTHKRE